MSKKVSFILEMSHIRGIEIARTVPMGSVDAGTGSVVARGRQAVTSGTRLRRLCEYIHAKL